MKSTSLIQTGDTEFERTQAYPGDRVWIKVTSPDGASSADIGILVNSEGVSIDVWAPDSDGCKGPDDGPITASWVLWSDIEERCST